MGSRLADPSFDTMNGEFTFALSVKRTSTSTMQLLHRDTYRQHGAYIDAFHQHNGFAVTTAHVTTGSGVHATSPHDGVYDQYWGASIGVAPLNTWVHFALQWTGSDTNLYYNGVLQTKTGDGNFTVTHTDATDLLRGLGRDQYRAAPVFVGPWIGVMKTVQLYHRVLDATEIAALAA